MTKHELGPLPEPDEHYWDDDFPGGIWTLSTASIRAYALAEVERAVMAERERAAQLVLHHEPGSSYRLRESLAAAIRAQSAPKEQA